MGLSNDLVSQFVKVTKDTDEKKRNTTVYGTLVKVDDTVCVMLDGSEVVTPVSTLADCNEGDRVMINIDNHNATIIGNITSPSARVDDVTDMGDRIEANEAEINNLYANRITTDYLKTNYAEIGALNAANVKITNLEARSASIEELKADKADIDKLDTKYASIGELTSVKADITSLNSKYVDINFANIGQANIKEFFSKSGMIESLDIKDGHITGKLVAIEIDGDLIQAGSIVADKLVIRTEDGLLYKLNIDALNDAHLTIPEDTESLKNGLHGALILDKTIVADKIKVSDLVAFGATIGGFKIDSDSVHSVVKESIDNTTRGIYMDNDGQLNVGDASNFIKFYRYGNYQQLTEEPLNWSTTYRSYFSKINDKYVRLSSDTAPTFEAGKYYEAFYKLAVSADEVRFGSNRKNLKEALDEVANSSISDVDVEYCKSASSTELLERVKVEGIKEARQRDLKGDNVSIKLQSDNLLLLPYDNNFSNTRPSSDETVTSHGVTFKSNPDGSVSIWGTASERTNYSLRNYHDSPSKTTRIFVKQGTYTLGINTINESKRGSVRIYSNKYTGPGTVAIYNGAPQTFTLDADSESDLATFGITVTPDFRNVTEDSPVIAYPIFNEGTTLKDFTTPKHKSFTDLTSFIPKQNCIVSINEVDGQLLLDENDTVIINNSLSSIYVDAGLKYRVVLSVFLNPKWTTSSPKWEEGSYIWSRTKITNADNTVSYSDPVCIIGQGIKSITEQYYLSTSEVEPTNGDWGNAQPAWSSGRYIWTRSFITWSDNTTSTTDPTLAHAINDANSNADRASSDAGKANDAAEDAKEIANQAYSEISKLNDSIKNLVVGKDGSTLMTQTPDGWQFNFGNFKETIDDIGKKTAYVHIDETVDGNPKIELGKADNKSKLVLTNEDIQFVVGSEVPTKVTSEGLDTDKIKVDNEFAMGRFVWKNRKNGNLGLSWKGVKS